MNCVQCQKVEVAEEYTRCEVCNVAHKELCAKLDASPKQKVKKIKEELFAIKSIRRGVKFTDLVSRADAAALGIRLETLKPYNG